jgi:hypothetical protein
MSISPASSEVGSSIVLNTCVRRKSANGGGGVGGISSAVAFPPLPATARPSPFSSAAAAGGGSKAGRGYALSSRKAKKPVGVLDDPDRADRGKQLSFYVASLFSAF